MTVHRVDRETIQLADICSLEDVEPLMLHLFAAPRSKVDWRTCDLAHTAVIQLMLVSKVAVRGQPRGEFLKKFIDPLFSHV